MSTSVDITVYLYGKNVLYFFYNTAQKNTKLLQWMSGGKFSVLTLSYVNPALNQSAIRIHKCYITKECKTIVILSLIKVYNRMHHQIHDSMKSITVGSFDL